MLEDTSIAPCAEGLTTAHSLKNETGAVCHDHLRVELTDFILGSWGWQEVYLRVWMITDVEGLHRALLTWKCLLTRWNATHFWRVKKQADP